MVPMLETKISSPSAVIKIITDMQSEKNPEYFHNSSKELERDGREYKETSSTQTSSSSSLLHKRKVHSYYVANGFYKSVSNHNMTVQNHPKRNMNSMTQRIISAKFLRVKQLQNELTEAHKKINDLQEENRTLKNIQKRQDSALKKYESHDSYLPQLLKSHEEEMRILTIKYKKLRGSYNDLESRYNKQFTELTSLKERYRHLLQISQDKHLLQRERLTRQIEEMKIVINDLKNKTKLQSRKLDLEVKNYKYQLMVEFNKQKSLKEQLKQYQDTIQKLQTALEDKDKVIANNKINHHVMNKATNQCRLNKLPSCSLKPTRLHPDDDNPECSSVSKKQDKRKNYFKNNKQNNSSNELTNIHKHNNDSYCERKHDSDQISKESDDNNNMKPSIFEYNNNKKNQCSDAATDNDNCSIDSFEQYEKAFQDESNSEKSEDFKTFDETVSWLELHEKLKRTEIHVMDTPSSIQISYDDTTSNKTEPKSQGTFHEVNSVLDFTKKDNVDNSTNSNKFNVHIDFGVHDLHDTTLALDQLSANSLPNNKKVALLEALKQIDLEVRSDKNETISEKDSTDNVRKS